MTATEGPDPTPPPDDSHEPDYDLAEMISTEDLVAELQRRWQSGSISLGGPHGHTGRDEDDIVRSIRWGDPIWFLGLQDIQARVAEGLRSQLVRAARHRQ